MNRMLDFTIKNYIGVKTCVYIQKKYPNDCFLSPSLSAAAGPAPAGGQRRQML